MATTSGTKDSYASRSGTKGSYARLPRTSSISRTPTRNVELPTGEWAVDSELVPTSLAHVIVPILRAANEIQDNSDRVANLCRRHAYDKIRNLDTGKISSGRGVEQFETDLRHRLQMEKEGIETGPERDDFEVLQSYYQGFYEEKVRDGEFLKKPEEMAKILQIASVLYDVLRGMTSQTIDRKTKEYAKIVENMRQEYKPFNILPLSVVSNKPAIMELPEIKAALHALRQVPRINFPASPEGSSMPMGRVNNAEDIFEWLSVIFGFQKGNVANQREHLILLLANIDLRARSADGDGSNNEFGERTVEDLKAKIFENYDSWCDYVHHESNIRFPEGSDKQQREIIYIALYLLIWGEASNVRFMPECICYIFHRMSNDLNEYYLQGRNPDHFEERGEEAFLKEVITPIYNVLANERKRSKERKASHSNWRNYDDLNEYFWSNRCFRLGWPMDLEADFFRHSHEEQPTNQGPCGDKTEKTNFVEFRTFLHLYTSFDRMWIFFILALQAMIIIAWSDLGHLATFSYKKYKDVFGRVMSIFITYAFLNFLRASLDIIFTWNAHTNTKSFLNCLRGRFMSRYNILKFVAAVAWVVAMPFTYIRSPSIIFSLLVLAYLLPNIVPAILFFFPSLEERYSNTTILTLLMRWYQPESYIGRAMHSDNLSIHQYRAFWIVILISKLAFSYYVEICPLVRPTKLIMDMPIDNYQLWRAFFSERAIKICIVTTIWAPIILVYFMDVQVWYAIFSSILGWFIGTFSRLGEIRTFEMVRFRFESVLKAFSDRLIPNRDECRTDNSDGSSEGTNNAYFSAVWNEFIYSMREEDLISNRERDLLVFPNHSSDVTVIQWPPFLLASKISTAIQMAENSKGTDDSDLINKVKSDQYMYSAVVECYETLRDIMINLLQEEFKRVVTDIFERVKESIEGNKFVEKFRMSGLASLREDLETLLSLLLGNVDDNKSKIIISLLDIVEIFLEDFTIKDSINTETRQPRTTEYHRQEFVGFDPINTSLTGDRLWKEKVIRLHLLLSLKEPAIEVPSNRDARRRIKFFANSLFMNMPKAPKVQDMMSFSVLIPYFKEDVLYSKEELGKENEDGISILFYLKTIYPDEWTNFCERIEDQKLCNSESDKDELIRHWASNRGQTLCRTVRGMMYYRKALDLQCSQEYAGGDAILGSSQGDQSNCLERARASIKFTFVVSCQIYGNQKKSKNSRDKGCYDAILELMLLYPSLRVAYIDEQVDGKCQKVYYSVLVKGVDKYDEEIYRIKLPGSPTEIGEGKPENQNHAIIFTRGEAVQTIDMNQDNYFEEAFKMRNVLEQFKKTDSWQRVPPTILGLREHIFTESVSSLAWFMSSQETSFVTIGQRILANPLRVRFHYGHPDIFDRIFHITRGGISKASKVINLSEDIFAGFNSTLRGGFITHHEYIQVGKGRDLGMNQISDFEAKVASGNGEQTLSRDVYRLGRCFDFFRMLSFYFTTVGFYFNSMVTVLTVYVFLYGRLYMVLSGVKSEILRSPNINISEALEKAFATQSVFQLGLLMVLPMILEAHLEKGFGTALGELVAMQLQLAPVFFTFQLGTKAHYYGRTILHGGSKYRPTGRGFVVSHAKFAENYRMYSRSHFVKGLEILILLIVNEVYDSNLYPFITISMWFLPISWLFAPFLFNPSGFDWPNMVRDWRDWKQWMGKPGGIGISAEKSWESWWDEENGYLQHTNSRGKVTEIILASRFFVYQYLIVYHMDIAHHSKSFLVYVLSWGVLITVLYLLTMVSMAGRRYGMDHPRAFRFLKAVVFLGLIGGIIVLFVVRGLTMSDLFAAIMAFMPLGWALIVITQAFRTCFKGTERWWNSMKELARAYEYIMGSIIFMPIAILSWFPFVSEFQTRLLFNQQFSRGLQISKILAGGRDSDKNE